MKKENSFVGQIDLLSILGAELKKVDSTECIVIPVNVNPTIEVFMRKNGKMSACLNVFMNESDCKYGNTHYVKAAMSKKAIERFSLTYEEARQFCPILGNLKPVYVDEGSRVTPARRVFNNIQYKK